MKQVLIIRRIVQAGTFLLMGLPVWLGANSIWIGSYLASTFAGIPLTDPLAALEVLLASQTLWWPLVWSAVPLVILALLAGRVFCSWICPLNTVLEFAAGFKKPRMDRRPNNCLPYIMLAVFLLAAFIWSLPFYTIISPIGILSRAVVTGAGIELVLVGLILLADWLIGHKTWCRRFCPVGALYGLLGMKRWLGVTLNQAKCTHCQRCQNACTMGVNVAGGTLLDQWNCTNCGDCIHACDEQALQFSLNIKQKGGQIHHESMERTAR